MEPTVDVSSKKNSFYLVVKHLIKRNTYFYFLWMQFKSIRDWVEAFFWCKYYKLLRRSKTFKFQGADYAYFYHNYHETYKNERIVEIPILWKILKEHKGKEILEVGNVLSHYFLVNHEILDKYEKGRGVINQDVVEFNPSKKYDLVISISTLEHVGWDEIPKDGTKILRAVENLKCMLMPKGKIVMTFPLGYNSELDELLDKKMIKFAKVHYLKRISADNEWIESDWRGVVSSKFDSPFSNANGLVIGIIDGCESKP